MKQLLPAVLTLVCLSSPIAGADNSSINGHDDVAGAARNVFALFGNTQNLNRVALGIAPDNHYSNSYVNHKSVSNTRAGPEPSIWKLFLISLLWIPFNRWERKQDQSDSGKNNKR